MTAPEPQPPEGLRTWHEVAAEQDGTLARWQALKHGMTGSEWRWKVSNAIWSSVLPGVAILNSGMPTDRQRSWAGVLHGGRGAALSGSAARVEYGVRLGALHAVDVAVPWPRVVQDQDLLDGPRLVCHSVRGLEPWVHPVKSPEVTRIAVATLHAAAWARSDRDAEWRIAAVVQQRKVLPKDVRAQLGLMPKLFRHALICEVLDDVELGAHAASELLYLRFCREHRLPLPDELQVVVRANGTKYLEARYRRQKVLVELDGAHHRLTKEWEADMLRNLEVAVAVHGTGETMIRLAPGNLRHDGAKVAASLRALLA